MSNLFSLLILICSLNVLLSVPLGGNIPTLRDWTRTRPYVNLIKQCRGWGNVETPWITNASFDPLTGWPITDFGIQVAWINLDLGGIYFLRANGNADVSLVEGSKDSIRNKTYDSTTNTLTAFVFVYEGTQSMTLIFQNTTGPGLQNLTLLQSGYNQSSQLQITDLMLAHLSRFSLLRFMEWTDTNENFEMNWNDTTSVSWPLYVPPKHNPWHTIPYLINQFNHSMDVWVNVPHLAGDDYILNLARLLLNELNPKSIIYVEYSNEVWNFIFPQAKANLELANDSVLHFGDPFHFNYDNISNAYIWANRRIAYQTKHISDLFKQVFGEENVGPWKYVRPIIAGQSDNPSVAIDVLDYLNRNYGIPTNFIHGIAIAPYFSLGPYKFGTNLTVDEVLDGLNTDMQRYLPESGWGNLEPLGVHAIYAAWYNVAVYAYEGGPDTVNGCGNCSLAAKINATRHPGLTDICVTFLNGWYRFGFETFNWYSAGADQTSSYSSFTLLEDMRQETLIDTIHMFSPTSPVAQLPRPAPKLKAIDQIRQSSINLTFGIPIPSRNVNATNYMNHPPSFHYPDLRNLTINSTFYYPVQIFESPIQLAITVYTGGKSGLLEGSINNGQFTQIETVQTENTTIYAPSPTIQFRINQTKVPSIVAFRLRIVQGEYSISSFNVDLSKN